MVYSSIILTGLRLNLLLLHLEWILDLWLLFKLNFILFLLQLLKDYVDCRICWVCLQESLHILLKTVAPRDISRLLHLGYQAVHLLAQLAFCRIYFVTEAKIAVLTVAAHRKLHLDNYFIIRLTSWVLLVLVEGNHWDLILIFLFYIGLLLDKDIAFLFGLIFVYAC